MKVKLSKAMAVLLLVLLTVAACGREPPFCNQPTIESRHDFRVRYFIQVRERGNDGVMQEIDRDLYAEEKAFVQATPEALYFTWRMRDVTPELWHTMRAPEIRAMTSVDQVDEPTLAEEYTHDFFKENYLLVITLPVGIAYPGVQHQIEILYLIESSGVVRLRPAMVSQGIASTAFYSWTVVIELDNRFQPPEFSVVFDSNPWASSPDYLPTFNLPAIEDSYDFRVRYFERRGNQEHLAVNDTDLHAEEMVSLQERPWYLGRYWRRAGFTSEHMSAEARVVTSFEELTDSVLRDEYNQHFFDNNFLVIIDLPSSCRHPHDMVYRVEANGNIVMRPTMRGATPSIGLTFWPRWTVVIELDNSFQPSSEFSVVFIANHWAH